MIKKYIFYCALFTIIALKNESINAQETIIPVKKNKIAFAEKIYLQLNSTVFTTDQIIWLKAIVTDSNLKPTILSKILHIELIDSNKHIIDTKLIKLENGIANSFFNLEKIVTPGRYMIRAYTLWNTNFKADLINRQYVDIFFPRKIEFKEEVIQDLVITENEDHQLKLSGKIFPKIINSKHRGKLKLQLDFGLKKDSLEIKKDKKGAYPFTYLLPKNVVKTELKIQLDKAKLKTDNFSLSNSYQKTVVVDKDALDLQFFPEGGKLIDGLQSLVAFKALDYNNKGIQISGNILDQDGKLITPFKTNTLGMGTCQLRANKNNIYYAEILNNKGIKKKYKLPNIYTKGYVLHAKVLKNNLKIRVTSNFSKTDSLFVKIKARGIVYHYLKLKSKNGKVNIVIEKNALPEGILTVVVENKNMPICERLLFNHKENFSEISIEANSYPKRYLQREKITFNIDLNNQNDNKPIKASTSFLVLNKKQLATMQINRQNIFSYFLLQSELKGTIEKPNYYFNKKNKSRFYDMDALLLSQGWRNYIYKPTTDSLFFEISPEQNLQISGSVKGYEKLRKKQKKPLNLTLFTYDKKKNHVDFTTTDSIGNFSFNLRDNYENGIEYLIQTKNQKGKKRNYTININQHKPPKTQFKKQYNIQAVDSFKIFVKANIQRKIKENPFSQYNDAEMLNEIKLKTYKFSPEQKKMNDIHGKPDIVISNKDLVSKKKDWSYGIFSILLFNYPKDVEMIRINTLYDTFLYASLRGADFTCVIIDGIPVPIRQYNLIELLAIDDIKSVDIVKTPINSKKYMAEIFGSPRMLGFPGTISFINIYTYSKRGINAAVRRKGIFQNSLPSFTPKKEFYAPKHENLTKDDWDTPDLRSVVHWEPNVKVDDNGKAKVIFYNDDNIGELLVIIESISKDGKLGYHESTYKVHKRLVK